MYSGSGLVFGLSLLYILEIGDEGRFEDRLAEIAYP